MFGNASKRRIEKAFLKEMSMGTCLMPKLAKRIKISNLKFSLLID